MLADHRAEPIAAAITARRLWRHYAGAAAHLRGNITLLGMVFVQGDAVARDRIASEVAGAG
jgi:hypothetical protein